MDTGVPELVTSGVVDPEGDGFSVRVHLHDADEDLIQVLTAVEQPDGTWRAVPTTPLATLRRAGDGGVLNATARATSTASLVVNLGRVA